MFFRPALLHHKVTNREDAATSSLQLIRDPYYLRQLKNRLFSESLQTGIRSAVSAVLSGRQASDSDLCLVFRFLLLAAALFALPLGEVGIIILFLSGLLAVGALSGISALTGLFGADAGLCNVISLLAQYIPDGACQADRGVGTADNTDHDRKRKLLDTRDTEDKQCQYHKEGGQGSKDTSGQSVRDALIDYVSEGLLPGS